jgi:hypothetical protein
MFKNSISVLWGWKQLYKFSTFTSLDIPLSMSLFSPAEIKEKRAKCWSIMCVHYSAGGANSVLLASPIQCLVSPSLSPELPHNWNNPIRVSAVGYNDFGLFRENAESIPLKVDGNEK